MRLLCKQPLILPWQLPSSDSSQPLPALSSTLPFSLPARLTARPWSFLAMRNRFLLSPLHFPLASRSSLRCSLEATPLSSFPLCAPRARESSLPRERALCSIVSSSSFSLRQVFFPAAELAVPPLSSSLFTRIPSSFAAPGLLLFMAARPDALLDRTPCCARSCAMRFARRRRQRRPCFSPTTASSAPSADRNALLGFRSRSSLPPAPLAVLVQAPATAPD